MIDAANDAAGARRAPADYRLLGGWWETGQTADLAAHQARYGPAPLLAYRGREGRQRLIEAVERAGLRGRGGAGFPTARKLLAVAAGSPGATVVVNACEGEPVSGKDQALLTVAPHLVLDGAQLAAHAVRAREVIICLHRGGVLLPRLRDAIAERGSGIRIVEVPRRYVASEESALVNLINTGDARPTSRPPLPVQRGVRGRPTLISNAETLAHLALIARHGPDWFRECGTDDLPGTALLTISGAVGAPGVYEAAGGSPIGTALQLADADAGQAVLTGGYGGTWLPMPYAAAVPLTHQGLAAAGAAMGVGALFVLPADTCGLTETARILDYLARESARQCGPCMFGLPAIAEDFRRLAIGEPGTGTEQRLRQRLDVIPRRGACRHPDGAVRLARSALLTFAADLRRHTNGRPCMYAMSGW
ncbi:NADH-ubiquinone oxidoreductase-F iron-sulfur binding region domain-containing protein [Flindersiella endophytica]